MTEQSELIQPILNLALVLLLVVACLWYLKQFYLRKNSKSGRLVYLETLAVGTKERVVLIQVDSRTLLLGVSPQNVVLLSELPEHKTSQGEETEAKISFSEVTKDILRPS